MALPLLPQDKANHLAYGAAIFSVALLAAHHLMPSHQVLIAGLAVLFMAVGKEANDAWINYRTTGAPPHGVELLDAVATCAGGLLAALPLFII
jgi:hypothetical protein